MGYAPISAVLDAPVPADSGTALTVQQDTGDRFPTPPFTYLCWPAQTIPTIGVDSEEGTVISIEGDSITVARGSAPVDIITGMQFAAVNTVTSYDLNQNVTLDYEDALAAAVIFEVRTPQGYVEQFDGGTVGPDFSIEFEGTQAGLYHWRPLADTTDPGPERQFFIRFSDVT